MSYLVDMCILVHSWLEIFPIIFLLPVSSTISDLFLFYLKYFRFIYSIENVRVACVYGCVPRAYLDLEEALIPWNCNYKWLGAPGRCWEFPGVSARTVLLSSEPSLNSTLRVYGPLRLMWLLDILGLKSADLVSFSVLFSMSVFFISHTFFFLFKDSILRTWEGRRKRKLWPRCDM